MAYTLDNWRKMTRHIVEGIVDGLLPQECLLCAQPSGHDPVCPSCRDDLPLLQPVHCPRCAMPVAAPATCGRCLARPPHFDATHAVFLYAPPGDRLITALKYNHRLPAAAFLATQLARSLQLREDIQRANQQGTDRTTAGPVDWVIGMPLHPQRLARRGFNQSVEIGRRVAKTLGLPFSTNLVQRRRETQPQAELPLKRRRANVRGAFACTATLAGRRVAVVDDVMTSGATLDEVARTLKRAGATHVENWVLTRAWPRG
jgi:ComF family protein